MSRQTPEATRAYYLANRERIIAYQRKRREENKEAIAAREKAYREANREKRNAQKREHYRLNHERMLEERRQCHASRDPEEVRAYRHAHYLANKEAYRERRQRWLEENAERAAEYSRQYARENAEATRERVRLWREANPERARELTRATANRRRARLQGGDPDLTLKQWLDILADFQGHCAYCERNDLPLVMEHMTPLARGGRHTASNVVPSCQPCNARKHTKTALEFAGWETPPILTLLTTT
jgi:hypothetical protein